MTTNKPPKLKIEREQLDWILEGSALVGLLLLFLLPITYYFDLPDIIPTHFNAKGEADDFGSKATIWILPLIGLGLYILLTSLNKMPHIFNYSVKITAENAEQQYRLATRMILILKLVILLLFLYICWGIIQGAISGNPELKPELFWVFMVGILFVVAWYMVLAYRKR